MFPKGGLYLCVDRHARWNEWDDLFGIHPMKQTIKGLGSCLAILARMELKFSVYYSLREAQHIMHSMGWVSAMRMQEGHPDKKKSFNQ